MGDNPINYWIGKINGLRSVLRIARQNNVVPIPIEIFFPNDVQFVTYSNRYTDNQNNRLTYNLNSFTVYPQVGQNNILGRIGDFDIRFLPP